MRPRPSRNLAGSTSRPRSSAQRYQGFDSHLHVTVTAGQRDKLMALAKREGISLSQFVRALIDGLEGVK